MGTNYYQRTDICKCCNRYEERHIGKSSCGWKFSFQGYIENEDNPKIQSFEDWKKELQADGKIFDEYGTEFPFEEFVSIVENREVEALNHFDWCSKEGYDMSRDWKDDKGFSFSSSEFS